jgi:hypothetical protein
MKRIIELVAEIGVLKEDLDDILTALQCESSPSCTERRKVRSESARRNRAARSSSHTARLGDRWKAFLPQASLTGNSPALNTSMAMAVMAKQWLGATSQVCMSDPQSNLSKNRRSPMDCRSGGSR